MNSLFRWLWTCRNCGGGDGGGGGGDGGGGGGDGGVGDGGGGGDDGGGGGDDDDGTECLCVNNINCGY